MSAETFGKLKPFEKFLAVIKYVFLLICVCTALFPFLWVIISSFKTNAEIISNGLSLPSSIDFAGYAAAFKMVPLLSYFWNSVIVAFSAVAINVFALAMAAYVFARFTFRGKEALYLLLSASLMIPMTALLHPVYMITGIFHLTDTKTGLVLVYSALNLPISLLILRGTFRSIPKNLEDAAIIDGAGFLQTFFHIMMPLAKGGLVSAGVLAFLNCWNEFTFALTLTSSQNTRTLPLAISFFVSQFSDNYAALFAALTIAIIPAIMIFVFFQEQVVRSLITGALKE